MKFSFKNSCSFGRNALFTLLLRLFPIDSFEFLATGAYYRASRLGFGEGTRVYMGAVIYGRPRVGRNVFIGPFAVIDGTGPLTIGDDCQVSLHAMVWTHGTYGECLIGPEAREQATIKETVIENNVFIGAGAIVLPGVHIGHHSLIGAGSVVTKDVPPYSLATGSPAKVTGRIQIQNGELKIEHERAKPPNEG